jgi:hypothetical protein
MIQFRQSTPIAHETAGGRKSRAFEDCGNAVACRQGADGSTGAEKKVIIRDNEAALELGEKARTDLGTLVSLFIKQLKRVNINSAETAVRVAELESLRSKVAGLEERLNAVLDQGKSRLKEDSVVTQKAGDGERPPTSIKETPYGLGVQGGSHSDNGMGDKHPMQLTARDIQPPESAIRG